MKGYCKCGKEIDETEFIQFSMCQECWIIQNAYNKGYSDACYDLATDDNDGEYLRMEDDYD